MSELPLGWTRCSVGDICIRIETTDPKAAPAEEFDYIDISSIDRDAKVVSTPKRLKGAAAPSRARQVVEPGDVLFSTVRPNLQAVARVPQGLVRPIASTGFCVLRPVDGVVPDFLFHAVLSAGFQARVLAKARGVSYPAVRDADILEEELALPPVAEQRAIVSRLQYLLARIDDGQRNFEAVRRGLHDFRRAVLQEALGCCVVPEGTENLPDLPSGWKWSTVADEGTVQLGRMLNKERSTGPHMRPYLRVANVLDDRLDLSDVKEMDFPPGEYERYRLYPGDILLNEGQSPELLGRAAMYRGELPDVCFQKTLLRFQAGERVDPEFALLVFRYYLYAGRFRRESRITTGIGHLTGVRFAAMEFPVPPLPQQRRLVTEVRRQLTAADEYERLIGSRDEDARSLRASVSQDAIAGKLVEQDMSDEPAAAIVKRILEADVQTRAKTKSRRAVPAGE
jgi:type I restriction enzyme S subunit